MAIVGKLTKLKSAIKRWPSLTKLSRSSSSSCVSAAPSDVAADNKGGPVGPLHPVYVGRSRRRYLVSSDVVGHPLFQELVDRASSDDDGGLVVSCEVVLFEHLLWMLESTENQLDSMDELAHFYNCSN